MNRVRRNIPSSIRGSALLAALCFCAVLGIALASYMGVCYHTLQTSSRNASSTYSFEMAETGLEEALGALNRSGYDWSDWTLNNAGSPKTATKTLSGFSFGSGTTGSAVITIENYDGRLTGTDAVLRATGTTTLSDGLVVTRKLQATAKLAPMFVNAVAATYVSPAGADPSSNTYRGVRFSDGGTVDSVDSHPVIPAGEDESAKALREWLASYSAVVSSSSRVMLVDAQIKGYVAAGTEGSTSPDSAAALMFNYTANTRVGGPNTRASVQVDQARLSSSPYQPVFNIKEPTALGDALPVAGTIGSSDPTAGEMIYRASELKMTSGILTVEGNVVIVVSGDFSISESAQIVVGSAGAPNSSLQIIVKGKSSLLHIGDNGILNTTDRAKNLAIFYAGDPDVSGPDANPVISTTNTDFCGVVYAPDCNLDFTVSSNRKFTGSIVAKTVTFTGTPEIHYDLDLRRPTTKFSCLETPFTVSSWQEISP
jgi:hypothetical protein